MKISDILKEANLILDKYEIEDKNLKIKLLLSNILNVSKEYLIINLNEEIDKSVCVEFLSKIELLKQNVPIQYIIGKQDFYGFEFFVNENVLIPQPDTEILVEEVVNYLKENLNNKFNGRKINVLDLCTGSGIIGICIKKILEDKVNVYASDISDKALEVAKKNAENLDADVTYIKSDLLDDININEFDIIVSNPPYIKTNVISLLPEEVQHEPHIALDGKEDGLYFYRKIIKDVKPYLNKNGMVFFEIGYDQREEVENLFKENGYINVYSKKDYALNDRIVVGMKGE